MVGDQDREATARRIEDALRALAEDNAVARRQLDGREGAEDDAAVAEGRGEDAVARSTDLRVLEAILFAAREPIGLAGLRALMPPSADVGALLAALTADYAERGVNLVRVAGKYQFQTAPDLGPSMPEPEVEPKPLSQAALETLAIIAYHQPVTRAEIEEVRGVGVSKGTLDVLLEAKLVRPRGRRRAPGRPMLFGTSDHFLEFFGLDAIADLPGKAELKAAGLLGPNPPSDFVMPDPDEIDMGEHDLSPTAEPDEDAEFLVDFLDGDDGSSEGEDTA